MLTTECSPPLRNIVTYIHSVRMSVFFVCWERERKALIESPRAVACPFEINSWDCSPEMTHEARYLIKGA